MSIWTEIVIPKTLEDFVEAKTSALAKIEQARMLIDAAEQEMNEVARYCIPTEVSIRLTKEEIERHVNRSLWRAAMDKTGFKQLMDSEAMRAFNDSVERDPPNFTIENIRSHFLSMFQDADMMFKRGLVNVFRKLDSSYRTNEKEPFKVGRKVVMGYMFTNWLGYLQVGYGMYSNGTDKLNDLDRVFKTLDGKKHNPRELECAINAKFKETRDYIYEDEYYRVKGFKNGNMHLEFKRADLLEKANDIIAEVYGATIPDARAAA